MQETISTVSAGSCSIGNPTNVSKEQGQKNYQTSVKNQEDYYKNLIISILAFCVIALAAFAIFQNNKIEGLSLVNSVNSAGGKLNDDNFREVYYNLLMDIRNNNRQSDVENSKSAGRVDGILSVISNQKPDSNDFTKIWHEGYYRGMNQLEDARFEEYVRGYHAACDDLNCPSTAKEKAYNGINNKIGVDKSDIPVEIKK